MLNKISRYAIIVILVVVAAVFLPRFYWKALGKSTSRPTVYYSPVLDDFVYSQTGASGVMEYQDLSGGSYTIKEYQQLLPFLYARNLEKWGVLPESIKGLPVTVHFIQKNLQYSRLRPYELNDPGVALYPLFESESDFTTLEYPNELFRIRERMEFITAATNTVDERLSVLFTEKLESLGFQFPARMIAGNPTNMKPFDEGYFILDSQNDLFHVKMAKGQPYCVPIPKPADMDIRYISVTENPRREFYGMILTQADEVYLIMYDAYRLVKLPLVDFDPDEMSFGLLIDPLNSTIQYSGKGTVKTLVTDRAYNVLAENVMHWVTNEEKAVGRIEKYLFPFCLNTRVGNSRFLHLDFEYYGPHSLFGVLFFLLLFVGIKYYHKEKIGADWFDLVVVASTGIYGFLAVLLVKTEPWD